MTHSPDINQLDEQPDLTARIQRRRETAEAALARFDGDRLALIAALSRRARAARNVPLGETETTVTVADGNRRARSHHEPIATRC